MVTSFEEISSLDRADRVARALAVQTESYGAIDAGGKVVDVYGAAVFVHQMPLAEERQP